MMRATMVSIKVNPASRSVPRRGVSRLLDAHIAGQPIDGDDRPPGAFAQHELAAAGTAIGKKAHPHQIGAELLSDGNLDVDGQAWREGAASRLAFKPGAAIADIDDEGLIGVASLRRRTRVA